LAGSKVWTVNGDKVLVPTAHTCPHRTFYHCCLPFISTASTVALVLLIIYAYQIEIRLSAMEKKYEALNTFTDTPLFNALKDTRNQVSLAVYGHNLSTHPSSVINCRLRVGKLLARHP
jgi:hypothetical protein